MKQSTIECAFLSEITKIPLKRILPTHKVNESVIQSTKFKTILASIKELGIIEPLVVYPESGKKHSEERYILLDGHLRFEALKMLGAVESICIISTDDEAYTYNRQINRISSIQEYKMIVAAIDRGVSTERIAQVLNLNIEIIKKKLTMLNGIDQKVIYMLKASMVAQSVFTILRKMKPIRQIEVAELMVAANIFTQSYAQMLLAGTKPEMLIDKANKPKNRIITPENIAKMQQEMEQLQQNYSYAEDNMGDVLLTFVVAKGYINKLLENAAINKYINQYHQDVFEGLTTVISSAREDIDSLLRYENL